VVFDSKAITEGTYTGVVENPKLKASYLSKYDPDFWKEYTIMEPNAAIQGFTSEME